jgi:hypothetical protein
MAPARTNDFDDWLFGQGLDRGGLARTQPRDYSPHPWQAAIEMIEKHGEAVAPGGVPAMSIRGASGSIWASTVRSTSSLFKPPSGGRVP